MTYKTGATWTPGPYHTKPENDYVEAQVWADGICIADVFGECRETRKANGTLFAAAPELYEALEALHKAHTSENHVLAAKALAKARG